MPTSDLDYLTLQVEALFVHDDRGRITATNEPSPQPAPRLFLGRTHAGNLWRVRADVPEATARTLATILAAEPIANDPRTPPRTLAALLDALDSDANGAVISAGPAFRFPETITVPAAKPPDMTPVRRLAPADIPLLGGMGWDVDTLPREFAGWEPMLALFAAGEIASLAFSSRNTPRAVECGVETLPVYRGRGYAPRVVATWAQAIRASGRIPLYSTAWENRSSQAVARTLGLIQYGSDFSIF